MDTRGQLIGGSGANFRKLVKRRSELVEPSLPSTAEDSIPATEDALTMTASAPGPETPGIEMGGKPPGDVLADLLTGLARPNEKPEVKIHLLNGFTKIARSLGQSFDKHLPIEDAIECIRTQLVDSVKEVRAAALRALRLLTSKPSVVKACVDAHLEIFIVLALEQPLEHEVERTQALKLVRQMCEVAPMDVPRSILASVVAVAEDPADKMARVCLECICEIALRNPHIVAISGGIRAMTKSALAAHSRQLIEAIVVTLMYILGNDVTRRFVRVDVDVDSLFAPFTDEYFTHTVVEKPTTADVEQRWFASRVAVVTIMRTWTGLIYMASSPSRLRAIIDVLRLARRESRIAVMDMLFELLHIDTPELTDKFDVILQRGTTAYASSKNSASNMFEESGLLPHPPGRINLLPKYKSLLLLCLIRAGLVESLSGVIKGEDRTLVVRATTLLGEVLHLASKFLPATYTATIQAVPGLVRNASAFHSDPVFRTQAQSAVSNLDRLHYTKHAELSLQSISLHMTVAHAKKLAPIDSLPSQERSRQRIKQMRAAFAVELDDLSFQGLIRESQVLSAKEFNKWDWDIIAQLISGPLQTPKRLEEAIHSKLIRRLLTFYRPHERQFSDVSLNDAAAAKYTRVGLDLFDLLMGSEEGAREIRENNVLTQIADCLLEIDPNAIPSTPKLEPSDAQVPMLTPERIAHTATRDYFLLIGKLSTTSNGLKLLDKSNIFGRLYGCLDRYEREDIIKLIICSLDYNLDSHARIILTKVLTSSTKTLRVFSTDHLRVLMRASVQAFAQWGIELLIAQLYDLDLEVCYKAVEVLDECCDDESLLNSLVLKRPALLHLGEPGKAILTRLLSTFRGLKYLNETGFTAKEMQLWWTFPAVDYVAQVESVLASTTSWYGDHETSGITGTHSYGAYVNSHVAAVRRVFRDIAQSFTEQLTLNSMRLGYVKLPVHFFGELSKTKDGATMIRSSGRVPMLVELLERAIQREAPEPASNARSSRVGTTSGDPLLQSTNTLAAAILEEKGALWTLGHIAASPFGIAYMLELDTPAMISKLLQVTSSMSLRGTCYYVLSMFANTIEGCQALEPLGWDCAFDTRGVPLGIALPRNPHALFYFAPTSFDGSWAAVSPLEHNPLKEPERKGMTEQELLEKETPVEELMRQIGNLNNEVLQNTSKRNIRKMKDQHPEFFASVEIYAKTFATVGAYSYHLAARRFLHEIFGQFPFTSEALAELDKVLPKLNPVQTTSSVLTALELERPKSVFVPGPPASTTNAPGSVLLARALKL